MAFRDSQGDVIDHGLALFFSKPASFTGEDVVELQVHGNPYLLDMLVEQAINLGARLAQPGEFSYRAFLNHKLDLAQAEAVADLIDANSRSAARLANRTLSGVFSDKVHDLVNALIALRSLLEASFDFSEEDIDLLSRDDAARHTNALLVQNRAILEQAQVGRVMRDGLHLVLAGKPNAGKSSLLNCLTGQDSAIVTEIPGTTRDVVREQVNLDGIPLFIHDTAGLRESSDPIEELGMERTRKAIQQADHLLWVQDDREDFDALLLPDDMPKELTVTWVRNKIDLTGKSMGLGEKQGIPVVNLSAKQGQGIALLKDHIKRCAGIQENREGEFIARRRHLEALQQSHRYIESGLSVLRQGLGMELVAEELRLAQLELAKITGEFSSDDLLGEIFSTFCIGK